MSNFFRVKNGLNLSPVDLASITNPQAGDLACDINDSNKIKRYDANSAAWTEVGSGGVGGTDILFVQDFESASLSSFTQTGLSLSQTDPLHGKVSALLTHQAAINQSFKQVIAVDRKFRGEAMTMRLNVKSNAPAGDVTINIYDETNAANLVASEQLQLANDTSGVLNRIGFTIPETCASLSYTITALPEAGSPVTRVDDIIAELAVTSLLETSVAVPVITGWQGYTPTFQGFGTPTAVEFEWRQVGEDVEIRGKFVSGTSTAVEARIGLPGGLTSAGTTLIPSIQPVGVYAGNIATAANAANDVTVLIEPSVTYVTFRTPGTSALSKSNANTIAGAGVPFSFFAKVPCAGLSAISTKTIPLTQSGLIQSADSYTLSAGNAGQSVTANITNIPFIPVSSVGSDIIVAADSFQVVQTGIYDLAGSIRVTTSVNRAFYLYENGVIKDLLAYGNIDVYIVNLSRTLVAGVVYSIRSSVTSTLVNDATLHYLHVSKQGSLKQIAVSSDQKLRIPTSELRFEGASSRGSTATSIVRFDSVAKIRGDAFTVVSDAVNGTAITMTKAGKLDVSFSLLGSSTNGIVLSKNQTTLTTNSLPASEILALFNPSASGFGLSTSWSGFVAVGDIIRVAAASTPTANNGNQLNLSFQEQDIAVSVSNVLPQFSESDSSVRVTGGNGFTGLTRLFSNVIQNIGSDVQYTAASGQFRAMSSGIYNITYQEESSVSSTSYEIYVFVNETLTAIANDRINTAATLTRYPIASIQLYLSEGDIVTGRVAATASFPSVTSYSSMTISKVGKPNVTGVNVTPFVQIPQNDVESVLATSTTKASNNGLRFSLDKFTNKGILTRTDDATNGTRFVANKKCTVNVSCDIGIPNGLDTVGYLYLNNTIWGRIEIDGGGNTNLGSVTGNFELMPGDYVWVFVDQTITACYLTMTATAASDTIITASESFSTDTASLTYAPSSLYTLSTLNTAPVGTFITFTYAINTNTRTQTTTAPTQTTADMNANGMLIYTRAYNAASTAAQPVAIAIQIGKGLKGKSLDLYKSVGKVTAGSLDMIYNGSSSQYGLYYKEYSESTGILFIDAGTAFASSITSSNFQFVDITSQTSGYLVINASKSPALVGVPLFTTKIATLRDQKTSGTASGTSSTAYSARTLNTLEDPYGIVLNSTSFTGTGGSNTDITLSAGTYSISGSVAFSVGGVTPGVGKARLFNVTDSSVVVVGQNAETTGNAQTTTVPAPLAGVFSISSQKTFQVQFRTTAATNPGNGKVSSFDTEVYATIQIEKLN